MGGPRILSDAQLIELAELREQGWTQARIARHFTDAGTPISEGIVHWWALQMGADLPPERRHAQRPPERPYQRGSVIVRPFTPEEDAILIRLEQQGVGYMDIARRLDRRRNSIVGRLMTLARRDARQEEAA